MIKIDSEIVRGTVYEYDIARRLASQTDPNGNGYTLSYDAEGMLIQVANSFGRTLTFTYSGDHISTVSGGGATVQYTYDANGRLITYRNANGYTTSFNYDDQNHITQIFLPSFPSSPRVVNTYDDLGRVATQSIGGGPVYHYYFNSIVSTQVDPAGNMTRWYRQSVLDTHTLSSVVA